MGGRTYAFSGGDISDFVITSDIAIHGTIVSAREVYHDRAGSSRVRGQGPVPGWEFTIRPDSVILGSVRDTLVRMFVLARDRYPSWGNLPGQSVLAYLRWPTDDDTYWGQVEPIGSYGRLVAPEGMHHALIGRRADQSVTYQELLEVIRVKRVHHALTPFSGTRGVALMRIREQRESRRGARVRCELVRWVVGEGLRAPRTLELPTLPGCRHVSVGDSLLVPVPAGAGEALALRVCAGGLRVRDRFVPVLSCPIERVTGTLVLTANGVQMRTPSSGH